LHLLLRQQAHLPAALDAQVRAGVASIEAQTGMKFGDLVNPLLVPFAQARAIRCRA